MNRDFVCVPGEEQSSFEEAIERLVKAGVVSRQSNQLTIASPSDLRSLATLLVPFLVAYITVYRSILSQPGEHWTEPHLVSYAQKHIAASLLNNEESLAAHATVGTVGALASPRTAPATVRHSILSTDLLKNGFQSLVAAAALVKTETNNGHYAVDVHRTALLADRLGSFVPFDWQLLFPTHAKL